MTSFRLSSLRLFAAALVATALAFTALSPAHAEAKKDFKVGWSIYVGWMPWGYAMDHGIVKKWADKYDINIELVQFNDYIEGINQFTAGAYDGVMATNMDALAIPSAGGHNAARREKPARRLHRPTMLLKEAGTRPAPAILMRRPCSMWRLSSTGRISMHGCVCPKRREG